MKIKGVFLAVILAAVLCISGNLLAYSGGDGTACNPYQIANVVDFQQLTIAPNNWNMSFILTADIDLTGLTFTQAPIAPDTDSVTSFFQGTQFTGIFDGSSHTISNLTITASTKDYIGLFGHVGSGGQIRNLGVVNVNITGRDYVGGLVGDNDGMLTACYATGPVSGRDDVGGLVGYNSSGTITSCYATGSVSGRRYIGGLVGENHGWLTTCYATGPVSGTDLYSDYIGGLVGFNHGWLTTCYATGSVTGTNHVGGLVGENFYGTLTACYATGSVTGTYYVGGLVGGYDYGSITASFWDTETSGQTISAGGTGKTIAQMKTLSTFTSAGWDFTTIWAICEGTNYPRLLWQIPDEDWVCPDGVSTEDLDYFVQQWLLTNCTAGNDYCDGADMDSSGEVNLADLAMFAQHWLEGV